MKECWGLANGVMYELINVIMKIVIIDFKKNAVMHFGKGNYNFEYRVRKETLENLNLDRDLALYVDPDLKFQST